MEITENDIIPHHKRVIIAGGGTGGHIFPAIAIANALKQLDDSVEILFVGAKGKMEMEKVPQAGYAIRGLDIAGFNRSALWKNIGLPFKILKSFFQVKKIFREFMPDAVLGVGGYSTYPVLRLAQAKGIPTFIHESNSFAGKANIMLGRHATRIFVATDGMGKFFPKEKILITGNPVRKQIIANTISRTEAASFFGLDPSGKTILAVGGSLGARSINEAIAAHIDAFAANGIQLIWQTGKTTAREYMAKGAGRDNICVSDFITDMEKAYAAADVVISRAGAMAVAEICVVAKPAIFVPFPLAAEDHQTSNAKSLVNKEAALMIHDSDARDVLVQTAIDLAKDESRQALLHQKIRMLGIKDADETVAKEILKTIHG